MKYFRLPEFVDRPKTKLYGRQHRNIRALVLKRDPICTVCKKEPSTEAHHIVKARLQTSQPGTEGYRGVCSACHREIEGR